MQFFKFMPNTLRTTVKTLFHSAHIKESKKKTILCNGFIKKDLKLRVKK